MATSKEKKRYHLTATSDGWSETGSGSPSGEDTGRGKVYPPRRAQKDKQTLIR